MTATTSKRKSARTSSAATPSKRKPTASVYNEDSIQHHKGLQAVRVRPGMYLGERGAPMVYRALKEIVDNAYDEYAAGRNLFIEVYADPKNNVYVVADRAQGIPVGLHKVEKVSTLTLILTELHAGGKFDDKAYSTAAGTHGVGAAATNAVSSSFECWTNRDKKWHFQSFKEGKPLAKVAVVPRVPADVVKLLKHAPKSGTVIRFSPDQSIVSVDKGKTKALLDVKAAASWLRNLAMMNKGLSITFSCGGKTKTYLNPIGISKMLKDKMEKMELDPMGKPLVYEDSVLSFAVQWSTYAEEDGVLGFVSSSATRDGGTHMDEFYAALVKVVTELKGKKDKFAPRDLRNGLVGVLNYKMSQPEFSSQVKDRLTSNLKKDVYDKSYKFFKEFFNANKSLLRKVIKRASDVKKTKEQFRKLMDGVAKINSSKRGVMLPNILATARNCKPEDRELYLVEGESAAGCFVGSTRVLQADGSTLTFDEMQRLEMQNVILKGVGFDRTTGMQHEFVFDEPRVTKYTDELIEVTLSDGSVELCTPDHPWLLESGAYVAAENLQPSDVLRVVRTGAIKSSPETGTPQSDS